MTDNLWTGRDSVDFIKHYLPQWCLPSLAVYSYRACDIDWSLRDITRDYADIERM